MLQKCRICLRKKEDTANDLKKCLEIIKDVAQIDICLDQRLPSRVCGQCIERLLDAYTIREMCIKSEEILMMELNEDEVSKSEVTDDSEIKDEETSEPASLNDDTKSHTESHTDIPLRCCVCNEFFPTNKSFTQHCLNEHKIVIKKQHLNADNMECRICLQIFDQVDFWIHDYQETAESEQNKIENELSKEELDNYVMSIVNESCCCQCPKTFTSLDAVRVHMKCDHPEYTPLITEFSEKNKIQCKVCLGYFKTTKDLAGHRGFNEKKPFECVRCDKVFVQINVMKNHAEKEHDEVPPLYKCNQCEKMYDKFVSLYSHLQTVHIADSKTNVCDICGKVFTKKYYLTTHREIEHFGIKKYTCEVCSKPFPRKANLNSHMKVHTGLKPYKCPYCEDKSYGSYTDMKTHVAAKHTGAWSIYCPKCNRGFMKPSQLKIHLKSHGVRE